ncbi:MAG: hypothetical protein ACLRWB_11375, partial [Gallintestinimicrobium sp.]|uniref:hypothetical protein n=1 Tax=Gallintestinimicrobium sp. TaxID=2981655 RepID=UPI0039A3745F
LIDPCALASSKKLIVFSCHLECGIKKLISQGAGFDVYLRCVVFGGIGFGTVFAAFRSGHK